MTHFPTPAGGITAEEIDDDICLYRAADGEVLVLNHTAADVWRLCDGEWAADRIAERLAEVHGADLVEVRTGVDAVLTELVALGFLLGPDA